MKPGSFYNNLTEFDWTLGFQRTSANLDFTKIDFDGEHLIGGSSLVLSAYPASNEPLVIKL